MFEMLNLLLTKKRMRRLSFTPIAVWDITSVYQMVSKKRLYMEEPTERLTEALHSESVEKLVMLCYYNGDLIT